MTGHLTRTAGPADLRRLDELLSETGRGDAASFADLYDALAPRVYGLAHRVIGDQRQAEHIAREVFAEVWRTAATFNPGYGSALAWTMTIAHRRAVERMRSKNNASRRSALVNRLAGSASDALDTLSPRHQESLALAYFGGHTHVEVSRLTESPLSSSATRLRDGLRCLRDAIVTPAVEPVSAHPQLR